MSLITTLDMSNYNVVKTLGVNAFELSTKFVQKFMIIESVMSVYYEWKANKDKNTT